MKHIYDNSVIKVLPKEKLFLNLTENAMDNTLEKAIVKIEKEKINQLTFSRKEVLLNEEARILRKHDLHRAQILGNISRDKVWITFETADGNLYQVNTTIWAVGSAFITLKCGVVIPINAIWKVE